MRGGHLTGTPKPCPEICLSETVLAACCFVATRGGWSSDGRVDLDVGRGVGRRVSAQKTLPGRRRVCLLVSPDGRRRERDGGRGDGAHRRGGRRVGDEPDVVRL